MTVRSRLSGASVVCLLVVGLTPVAGRADEMPKEYRESVAKGLEYLAKSQAKDGHWEAAGGQFPVSMTALCGLALLMEGSTLHEGRYQDNLRRAADWLMARSAPNGQIGKPCGTGDGTCGSEAGRYMYGHGYALLFLSCVYGEEEDGVRRRQLEGILTRAAKFSRDAQTSRGGWGYVTARDGNDFDEGSQTVVQVQALCAARDAGIAIPHEAVKDAMRYLNDMTIAESGAIKYSSGGGCAGPRPALTGAAVVCGFGAGDHSSNRIKTWLKFCQANVGPVGERRLGVDEYVHFYFAQVMYTLGDDGWAKLFPDCPAEERLTWTKYRKASFDHLVRVQNADGSWPGSSIGTLYATAVYCTIMQLDNGTLPIHQRKGLMARQP